MPVFAIADLHLSFGTPNKKMDRFGLRWENHAERLKQAWESLISPDDLVLIPGDISWAMRLDQVVPDLQWIHELPGTKVMIRGNHDYWWQSLSKIATILPPSIHLVQNNVFLWNEIAVGGTRLWDTAEYSFGNFIDFQGPATTSIEGGEAHDPKEDERIYERELQRLEASLKLLPKEGVKRVVMTHYPPIGADLAPSRVSKLLEQYQVEICVFGHLHNVRDPSGMFGSKNGVRYLLTACDALQCTPIKILD